MKNKNLYKLFHVTTIFIVLTSLVLWTLKEFYQVETPYGIRPHPWTSFWIHLHVITVPLLAMLLGVMIFDHGIKRLKDNLKKKSGVILIVSSLIMIFSGYCIQILVDPNNRSFVVNLHLVVSVIWILFYIRHSFFQRKA